MTVFRLGLHFSSVSYPGWSSERLFAQIVDVAQAAEGSGFDSVWVPDHAHQNNVGGGPAGPMLEAYTLLGALAARTKRVLLGAAVSPVTFRNPALLAKTIASLDVISGGRAVLGLGAAWDEPEHQAYGVYYPAPGERQDRLEEAVRICRLMFTNQESTFVGKYYTLHHAFNSPRPIQASIPIVIGGGGEKRTLRLVAQYADVSNVVGTPAEVKHKIEVLFRHCDDVGRDRSEITLSSMVGAVADPQELKAKVEQYIAAGVDAVILVTGITPDAATVSTWGAALASLFPSVA